MKISGLYFMKLVFIMLKTCCVYGIDITYDTEIHAQKIKSRLFYYMRLAIYLAIVITSFTFRVLYSDEQYMYQKAVTAFVEFVHKFFGIPITVACWLSSNFNEDSIVTFVNNFKKVRKNLFDLEKDEDRIRTEFFFLLIFCVSILKFVIQQIPFAITGFNFPNYNNFLEYLIFSVSMLLMNITIAQWLCGIILVKQHFRMLNQAIKTLKYRQFFVIYDLTKTLKDPIEDSLKKTGIIYDDLCDQCKILNKAFAYQMLVYIPWIFLEIIFTTFSMCHTIKNYGIFNIQALIIDGLYLVSFLEIVIPCIYAKEEAEKFVTKLNKFDIDIDNEKLDDLGSLTLETYHQKVEFTSHGLYSLDGTLLYQIFGALTTYLVILLQFEA